MRGKWDPEMNFALFIAPLLLSPTIKAIYCEQYGY
jgi:hypothetical protein